jgi:hypothetical protein
VDHPGRQCYSPHLTPVEERALLRRNYLLLQAGQAALGLIGPNLLGIAVEPRTDAVVLHFAIAVHTAEVDGDSEDIFFELDASLSGGPEEHSELKTQIHVGQPDDTWVGRSHALLYLAKPTSQ